MRKNFDESSEILLFKTYSQYSYSTTFVLYIASFIMLYLLYVEVLHVTSIHVAISTHPVTACMWKLYIKYVCTAV